MTDEEDQPSHAEDVLPDVDDPALLLRGLFAHSPVPHIIFRSDGHPLVANRAYRRMFGAEPPPDYNVLRDEVTERSGMAAFIRRAFAGETIETPVFWYDPKELDHIRVTDANRVAIACSAFPLGGRPGAPSQVVVAFKDVTAEYEARERAEQQRDRYRAAAEETDALAKALHESEARLLDTLEAAEVGTWEWNIRENRVHWSANIESIFGLADGSFAGTYEAWLALVHPADRDLVSGQVNQAIENGQPYETEFRFLRGGGSGGTGWQHARGYLVSDEAGKPLLFRGIVFDVTSRRLAEEALKMPARVLESMAEGVSLRDENGVILFTNPAEDRMFGYARGELVGQRVTVQSAHDSDESERMITAIRAEIQHNGQWSGERVSRRKDGSVFTTRSHITRLEIEGRPHWVCVQSDITDEAQARQRAETLGNALRDSEARYRAFVSQSSEGIWRIEVEVPISVDASVESQIAAFYDFAYLAECNDAMARMYGYEHADQLRGKRLGEFLVREDPRNHAYLAAFVTSGYRLDSVESRERDRHGKLCVFQNSLVGVVEDGHVRRAWGTQRDITGEVQAREDAETASRSKDEFLAMLGHELRNPLSPILTALELMKLRDGAAFSKERSIIERQVRHVVRLVDDLLDVSRMTQGKISLDRRPVDLADMVASGIELASPLLEQRAHRLSVQVPRGLIVSGDPTRLGQVFANLLTNAAKYTPSGGSVVVSADHGEGHARVRVRDSGIGIRPEMLPNIFDMFVQERQAMDRAEGGLGLGLAIVRSLVALHGGTVEALSAGPGLGSEFILRLPLIDETSVATAATRRPATVAAPADGWRILIVDDNQDAAALLAEALTDWGHVVRVAHDGAEALKALDKERPDLALLDIGLPVMDGYELARRIRSDGALRAIRLLAVTGYGQSKDRIEAERAGFDAHLVKPVDLSTLQAQISRLMTDPTRRDAGGST